MNISEQGVLELANYEALSNYPYLDSGGVKTVGIGSTISDIKDLPSWAWNKFISNDEAVRIYITSLEGYVKAVNNALKVSVAQHQFDALVSICYNIGTGGMAKSTFMRLVNEQAAPTKIVNAMGYWNKDNGKVVRGLVNRRAAEGRVYEKGLYTVNDGCVTQILVDSEHQPRYKGRVNISQEIQKYV